MKRYYLTIGLCFLLFGCSAKNENENTDVEKVEQEEEEIFLDLNPSTEEEIGKRDLSTMASRIQGRWVNLKYPDNPIVIYINDETFEYVDFDEDEEKYKLLIHEYDIKETGTENLLARTEYILTESYDPKYTMRVTHKLISIESNPTKLHYITSAYFQGDSEQKRKEQLIQYETEGTWKYLGPETSYTRDSE